jgi:hypothetical protein
MAASHLEYQGLIAEFHENPPIDSKVIIGGHTDRLADKLSACRFHRPHFSFQGK